MSEACEDRDGRAGRATTMLQPVILRLTHNSAAFAASTPILPFKAVVDRR